VAGLVWLLAAATVAGRRVRRMVLLRSAVPANATIRSVRLTDSYADEWRLRRFVVVEWSTGDGAARRRGGYGSGSRSKPRNWRS
jgi:hypothetical protein